MLCFPLCMQASKPVNNKPPVNPFVPGLAPLPVVPSPTTFVKEDAKTAQFPCSSKCLPDVSTMITHWQSTQCHHAHFLSLRAPAHNSVALCYLAAAQEYASMCLHARSCVHVGYGWLTHLLGSLAQMPRPQIVGVGVSPCVRVRDRVRPPQDPLNWITPTIFGQMTKKVEDKSQEQRTPLRELSAQHLTQRTQQYM